MDWLSGQVPSTIRRPWRVYEEDLEYKLAGSVEPGSPDVPEGREAECQALAAIQARGARLAFVSLPESTQRAYAEVSLMELAAYVCWRRAEAARLGQRGEGVSEDQEVELKAAWDQLDCDDKVEWVPQDTRAALGLEACWASLLADGAPPCGLHGEQAGPSEMPNPLPAGQQPGAAADAARSAAPSAEPERLEGEARVAAAREELAKLFGTPCFKEANGADAGAHPAPSTEGSTTVRGRRSILRRPAAATGIGDPPAKARLVTIKCEAAEAAALTAQRLQGRHRFAPAPALPKPKPKPKARRAPAAALAICSEAWNAVCSVCRGGETSGNNDIGLCDGCDKAFHQQCHRPPVATFGSPDDQWFCTTCAEALARQRGLRHRVGDFVWARLAVNAQPWPAQVLRMDFSSPKDPRPYWVQFFLPDKNEGAWLGDAFVQPWPQAPRTSVLGAGRLVAVKLAEVAGAAALAVGGSPPHSSRKRPQRGKPPPLVVLDTDEEEQEEDEEEVESPATPCRRARSSRLAGLEAARGRGSARAAAPESAAQSEQKRPRSRQQGRATAPAAKRVLLNKERTGRASADGEDHLSQEATQIKAMLAEAHSRQRLLEAKLESARRSK